MENNVGKQDLLLPETPSKPSPTIRRQQIVDVDVHVAHSFPKLSFDELEGKDQALATNLFSQSQCDDVNINHGESDMLLTPPSTKKRSSKRNRAQLNDGLPERERPKKKVYWPKVFDETKTKTKRKSKSQTNNVRNTPNPSTPKQKKSYVRRRPSCMGPLFTEDNSASLPFLEKSFKVVEGGGFNNSLSKNELGSEYNSLQTYEKIRSLSGSCLVESRRIGINFPRICMRKRKGRGRPRLEKFLTPYKKGKRSKSFIRKKRCWMEFKSEGKIVISKGMKSLIKRIQSLKKRKAQQKPNQIVIYKDHQLVPYKGRDSKAQGEVEIDGETLRVWNMLIDGKAHEDADEEKRKYWEEKRNMYRKRIYRFMDRIHHTLGDRRFKPWKGSVMDSVVGVYLTQNVYDYLSSEAFMNLAAKFPVKTTSYGESMEDLSTPNSQESVGSNVVFHDPKFDKEIEDKKVEEMEAQNAKDSSEVDNKGAENNSSATIPGMISGKQKLATTKKILNKEEKDKDKKEKERHWDILRKIYTKSTRHSDHEDSVDWEAVRCAKPSEIAETIKCRGQHNIIGAKIQRLLNHLKDSYGNLDLEWLRYAPQKDVKEYLLSIYGLGLKSVECIRLLALQHNAFPVDVNVGRIVVRLGWVPLKPLPESMQIHDLQKFPKEEDVQKYLWPRICTLDQRDLYELHYQLITFGKVFCRKGTPNCNACPMKEEGCKYYESKFASKKLELPAPTPDKRPTSISNYRLPFITEVNKSQTTEQQASYDECEPMIEMPASPEIEFESEELDEFEVNNDVDFYKDDVSEEEFLTINLSQENLSRKTHNYSWEDYEEDDINMSQDLVMLPANAANIPVKKIIEEKKTRTERLVYVIPNEHPLLEEHTPRLPDDLTPYLLVIYTKGELKSSCEPTNNNSQEEVEDNIQTVPGTLLIPCRSAIGGRFPLNGTYFQTNEVFADYDSMRHPINVPRRWLWNLEKRVTYFGTGISTIVKDMTEKQIRHFFWNDFVCVKAIEARTRFPRPLWNILHRKPMDEHEKGNKNGRENEE